MDERLSNNTGVRLTPEQRRKLDQLAVTLNTSRNRVFGMLIDNARVEERTVAQAATVLSAKNNRHDAQNLTGSSITAVEKV